MRRRDFIKKSALAASAIPFFNKISYGQDTTSENKNNISSLSDFFYGRDTQDNFIKEIFQELINHDIKHGHFYQSFDHFLIGEMNLKGEMRLNDSYTASHYLKYKYNEEIFQESNQNELTKDEVQKFKDFIEKKHLASLNNNKRGLPSPSSPLNNKNESADTAKAIDTTKQELVYNKDEIKAKEMRWEEKILNRSIEVPDFPGTVSLKEKIDFLNRIYSIKNRYFKSEKNIMFQWLEWQKEYGSWILDRHNMRDRFFTVSFQMKSIQNKAPYRINWGGMIDINKNLINLSNSEFENSFKILNEQMEKDNLLPINQISSDFFPILLSPGNTAKFWGITLCPYFMENRLYDIIKKDGGSTKFSKDFSLYDDPRKIESPMNRVFDDEGFEVKKHGLIQNGELGKNFITLEDDWGSQPIAGEHGRSRIIDVNQTAKSYPMFVNVEPKTDDPLDLKKAYSKTVLISELGDILLDKETGNFSAQVKRGYLLENGTEKSLLVDAFWFDNIFEILKKIKGIGKDLVIDNYLVNSYNNNRLNFSSSSPTILITESLVTLNERVLG